MLKKPFRPGMQRMIAEGGHPSIATRQSKSENMVLFSQDKDDFTADVISAYNKNPTSASLGKTNSTDSADRG